MIKFGTGGWRAIIAEDFTKDNIQLVAKAMVSRMRADECTHRQMVIGYDRRFLSKEAMIWIGEVIASNGIKTMLVDRSSPTPLIMYYVMTHELPYGMMVTASHNPATYNGIKLFTAGGRDANEVFTADIETRIEQIMVNDDTAEIRSMAELVEEGVLEFFNPLNEYLDSIIEKIDMRAIRDAKLRIAIDPLFGVSIRPLNIILSTARCEIEMLHSEHDTLFAGKLPAPTSETVRTLQNYVTDYKFDLGIATDGDADRLGLIDDTGHYVDANEILSILYYYFLEYKKIKSPVVKNIATTCVLDKIAEAYGQSCYEVPVGFKYISAKMEETGAILGGESSGGMTVTGHINGKDGIYAAALLVEIIAKTRQPLSVLSKQIKQRFGSYKTLECNLPFATSRRAELIRRIYEEHELPELPLVLTKTSYADGCKVFFENGGWLVIRFSGTEPLLRIFCEMPEEQYEQAIEISDRVRKHFAI